MPKSFLIHSHCINGTHYTSTFEKEQLDLVQTYKGIIWELTSYILILDPKINHLDKYVLIQT